MRYVVALGLGLLLVGQTATASAASATDDSTPVQVAYGAGSALGTLVYSPFKAGICILGTIAAGVTYPFAGGRKAGDVVGTTCRGTWVINPDNLKGRERVELIWQPPASAAAPK